MPRLPRLPGAPPLGPGGGLPVSAAVLLVAAVPLSAAGPAPGSAIGPLALGLLVALLAAGCTLPAAPFVGLLGWTVLDGFVESGGGQSGDLVWHPGLDAVRLPLLLGVAILVGTAGAVRRVRAARRTLWSAVLTGAVPHQRRPHESDPVREHLL